MSQRVNKESNGDGVIWDRVVNDDVWRGTFLIYRMFNLRHLKKESEYLCPFFGKRRKVVTFADNDRWERIDNLIKYFVESALGSHVLYYNILHFISFQKMHLIWAVQFSPKKPSPKELWIQWQHVDI